MKSELKNYPNKLVRSFGRIKSRKLSSNKKDLLENFLTNVLIDFKSIDKFSKNSAKNILEIGFGFGDFIFNHAHKNPQNNYFGFEPHLNGIVHLLELIKQNKIKNIHLSSEDIRLKVNDFPNDFFHQIYILFPDPWPKFKHHKRRLISSDFLDNLLADKLKISGKIIIASDHQEYQTWILSHILNSKKFNWTAKCPKDWQEFPDDWTYTKYQKKAEKENRKSIILTLNKK